MSALKLVYFLMAIVHGGPEDTFTLTRLAAFSDAAACETAAQTMSAAMSGADKD